MNLHIDTTHFDNFIIDIGNVLLEYNDSDPLLRSILATDVWQDFELGGNNCELIYKKLSSVLEVNFEQIVKVIEYTREAVSLNTSIVEDIFSLRDKGKRVIGLTNMPQPFYAYFKEHFDFWPCFTDIYVSSKIGKRKPDPEIFRHVIQSSKLAPSRTLVIDDSAQNVSSARDLGLKAVFFDKITGTISYC